MSCLTGLEDERHFSDLRRLRDLLPPEGGWLMVEEVMAMLGVTKQRVSFLVKQGMLPARRLGHRLLIEEASVRKGMAAPKDRGGRPHIQSCAGRA